MVVLFYVGKQLRRLLKFLNHSMSDNALVFALYLFRSTPLLSVNSSFFRSIQGDDLGMTTAQHGHCGSQPVHIFVKLSGEVLLARTTTLSAAGTLEETFLCYQLHDQDLPCTQESGQLGSDAKKSRAAVDSSLFIVFS